MTIDLFLVLYSRDSLQLDLNCRCSDSIYVPSVVATAATRLRIKRRASEVTGTWRYRNLIIMPPPLGGALSNDVV